MPRGGSEGSLREKGASLNAHVRRVLELQVREGRDEEFRVLMAEMAAATEASEPGTLDYEWSLSVDGRQCHLWERYADTAAAMLHAATFGSRWAARFFDVLALVRLVHYGSPSAEVRAALAAFNPVVLEPAALFSR